MYNDELKETTVCIDQLFLDPNNPRFWGPETKNRIPDRRATDPDVQRRIESELRNHAIKELQNSILRNGFLPLDRIVVRLIKGTKDKYVVVEGNRRLAALRQLRQRIRDGVIAEENVLEEYLERLVEQTNRVPVLVYSGSEMNDISWILQGIRHIGGIRSWDAAQRAKLVADQVDEDSATFTEAGQKFGLTAHAVGRLYRCHKALEQMRQDDEFGGLARNDYFTLFQEAYRNAPVRRWLEWDDKEFRYKNLENLRTFYSWISPDDDDPKKRRRIHNQEHVKFFADLIEGEHQALISRVDRHEIGLNDAARAAADAEPKQEWRDKLQVSVEIIKSLPLEVITESPQQYRDTLVLMTNQINKFVKIADALLEDQDDDS
ncbi:MAG: ParB N-terminal domain-containing protein [Candidatus Poribacteria bacterium]|nr:ParB N-terminal domain-containing protein [Candidatus Poribacteria bacterium]